MIKKTNGGLNLPNKCVYIHYDNNGQPFYVGAGTIYRPKVTSKRSNDWYLRAADGFTARIIASGLTKKEALALERITTRQLLDDGAQLVNIQNTPKARGARSCKFVGLTIGKHADGTVFVSDGAARLDEYGYNYGNVGRCILGYRKTAHGRVWTRIDVSSIYAASDLWQLMVNTQPSQWVGDSYVLVKQQFNRLINEHNTITTTVEQVLKPSAHDIRMPAVYQHPQLTSNDSLEMQVRMPTRLQREILARFGRMSYRGQQ